MKILVVVPHDTLLSPQGARERLDGLLRLLPGAEFLFLVPASVPKSDLRNLPAKKVFTFNEHTLAGRSFPFFCDLSFSYRKVFKQVIDQERVDLAVFLFPWGMPSAARLTKTPLLYFSQGVEKDFAGITLDHLHANLPPFNWIFESWVSAIERKSCNGAAMIISMSKEDNQRYLDLYGADLAPKLYALPQPVAPAESLQTSFAREAMRTKLGIPLDRPVVVFHGTWSHLPNRRAILSLINEIAPALEDSTPEALILILGKDVPHLRRANVLALGFVPELKPVLAACDLAAVPIYEGCGVRMKIFDYFSTGVPVVTTQKGIEGLADYTTGLAVVTPDQPAAVAAAVAALLKDAKKRAQLADTARGYLLNYHNPEVLQAELRGRLSAAMA